MQESERCLENSNIADIQNALGKGLVKEPLNYDTPMDDGFCRCFLCNQLVPSHGGKQIFAYVTTIYSMWTLRLVVSVQNITDEESAMMSYNHFTRIERIKLEKLKKKVTDELPESEDVLHSVSAENFVGIKTRTKAIITGRLQCRKNAIRHLNWQKKLKSRPCLR